MLDPLFQILNNNRLFTGCLMILMNIGGKHVSLDISKHVDQIFSGTWIRRFFVFCIAFISTRDIKTALLITLLFIIIFKFLLNEKSTSCIIPQSYLTMQTQIQLQSQQDIPLTPETVQKAKNIIERYEKLANANKIIK